MTTMPVLPMETIKETFDPHEIALIKETVKAGGVMKSSRPKRASGRAQFLWRSLVFSLSLNPRHQCIPVTSEFYLFDELKDWDLVRAESKVLDNLATRIEQLIPIEQRHGTLRWGRALGMI